MLKYFLTIDLFLYSLVFQKILFNRCMDYINKNDQNDKNDSK